jgi:hypothetical protein
MNPEWSTGAPTGALAHMHPHTHIHTIFFCLLPPCPLWFPLSASFPPYLRSLLWPLPPQSTSKGGLRPKRATPGDAEPLIFDILNIFCCHWFLSKDHLLTNVILAQKAEDGNISWVEFTPQYHSAPTWSSVLSHLYLTLFTR